MLYFTHPFARTFHLLLLLLASGALSGCGLDAHRQGMVRRVNLPGGWQATGLPYRLGGEEAPLPGALGLDSLSLAEIYIYGHDTCRLLPSPGGPHLSLRWAYDEHSNELTLSRMDDDGAEAELYATLRIIPQDTLLYVGVGTDPASGKTLYKPFRRVYWFY